MIREFKFSGLTDRNKSGHVEKFWNIELDSLTVTTQYGVVGTSGRSIVKDFASVADATTYFERKISEKNREGYSEVVGASPQITVYCTQCGGAMSHDDRFCRACGTRVNSPDTKASSNPEKSNPGLKPKKKILNETIQAKDNLEELWNSERLLELACASVIGKQTFLAKTTSGKILARFVNDPDVDIRVTVGSNVETTPESLTKLAKDADEYVRGAVAGNKSSPKNILKTLAKDSEYLVRWRVASNPSTSIEVLEQLARDDDAAVREFAAGNVNLPLQFAREVVLSLREAESSSILERLAEDPNTATILLEALAQMNSYQVRRRVADNPNTPAKTLELLSSDDESWVRESVATNPNTPRKVLEALAADDISEVAENPRCPLPILLAFVNSDEEWLRRRVAENPNLPANLLAQLANDAESDVRREVASNVNTSSKVLSELAKDDESDVREAVARNVNSTKDLLLHLSHDADDSVRSEIAANPSAPEKILVSMSEDSEAYVRAGVAGNESTPVRVLEKLALDDDVVVRVAVARNAKTPVRTLAMLLDGADREILWAIATNPQCEPTILESLSTEYGEKLRGALITHEKLTHDALRNILELLPTYEKVEAKTFKTEADEIAYARKMLNEFVKSSAMQTTSTSVREKKKYLLEVQLMSPKIGGDFEAEFNSSFDEFESDEEIYEFLERVWDNQSFSVEYGGEKKYKKFRDSRPFGDFEEGELVEEDNSGYWAELEIDRDSGNHFYRMAKSISIEVEALSEEGAKQFVEANVSRCFTIIDNDCAMDPDPIEITVVTSISEIQS